MPVTREGVAIYDKDGNIHDIEDLVVELSKKDKERILIDDDIGISIDVSDLEYYVYSLNQETEKTEKKKISTLHKRKKQAKILRITTETMQIEVSEDTILHIRDKDGSIKHIRADKLKEGMEILGTIKPDGTPGAVVY